MIDNNHLSIEIQNRLIEELTSANRELKLVNTFANLIQECKTTEDVVFNLVKNFESHFGFRDCIIYLANNESTHLNRYNSSINQTVNLDTKLPKQLDFGEDIIGSVALGKKPEISSQALKNKDGEVIVGTCYSEIAVPMLYHDDKVIGVMYFMHPVKNFFQEAHTKTLSTIASIAATKIIQTRNLEKIAAYQTQLEEYVHIVSHDLKSPLRSINALVHWIKEDNEGNMDQETEDKLNLIDGILIHMDDLIARTLSYSKIDHENTTKEMVDLNSLVHELAMTIYIPEHINFKVNTKLPSYYGDKTRFTQIFQNLIENAIKYIDKPKGEINVDYYEDKTHYIFSVADNGIGINEKYFKKIFEIFQSLNTQKVSSGVGLSIVKKLVGFYDGRIWLESTEGLGSKFYFSLKK
ncbi:phospho-acceptor domain-containing protein [Flavobacteriaceae bacterium MAR_2010_105]|nr:phospho-acceptor domain-containing protein [Flavobacteriaceae bacterium MAR_2010_105]